MLVSKQNNEIKLQSVFKLQSVINCSLFNFFVFEEIFAEDGENVTWSIFM